MSAFRKIAAAIRLALVMGVLWGILGAFGFWIYVRFFSSLPHNYPNVHFFPIVFLRSFVIGVPFGFGAGLLYAGTIALGSHGKDKVILSNGRAILFGALAGAVLWIGIRFIGMHELPISLALDLRWTGAFAFVGSVTSLMVVRTAARGALPSGVERELLES